MNDLARTHDSGFFSILIVPFGNSPGTGANGYPGFAGTEHSRFLAPFAPVADPARWTLLDLRPLREYPYYRALRGADLSEEARQELHRLVYGYDALLLMGGSAPATHAATHTAY